MVERKRPDGAIGESSVKALISLIISLPSASKARGKFSRRNYNDNFHG